MRCDDFWETEGPELLKNIDTPIHLPEHLTSCNSCREKYIKLYQGVSALKQDVLTEEPADFWHDMRREIHTSVCVDDAQPHRPFKAWTQRAWGWGGALVFASLLLFAVFNKPGPTPHFMTEDEALLSVGEFAASTVYDSVEWKVETSSEAWDEVMAYRGINDWNDLMIDVMENSI